LLAISDDEAERLCILVEEPAVDDQVSLRFLPHYGDSSHAPIRAASIEHGHA